MNSGQTSSCKSRLLSNKSNSANKLLKTKEEEEEKKDKWEVQ
jgi:hypothetical protein